DELRRYLRHTESNYDKKLFLGFGTVLGTRERMFAAPLLIAQCEISHDGGFVTLEPDMGTLSLNYDLISSLSPNSFNDTVDDAVNPLSDDENSAVEEYEQRIEGIDAFDTGRLNELAREIFGEFTRKLESFKNIGKLTQASYNFQEELEKYTYRPARRKNAAITPIKRAESLFEKGLSFVDANHFFLHAIPDQLSTFEALNNFVRDIGTETEFKNPVVEKMLANALTDSRVEIGNEDNDAEIQQAIDTAVPLSLSNSQVQALKNAWANEISYIQGPPGTGKSHTISALVLSAAALHKKILVLSEKTAALKVVKDKIE
ncbi:AAA domain-containing protein, partial [Treponema endosymbiont of Eucomonympha sp.]|uniref:AAA domain-containing protein n=1 Tax=Treponema endosymbiont of Eucomonympha sp. TaxID=1580831 RepID=UPI000A433833